MSFTDNFRWMKYRDCLICGAEIKGWHMMCHHRPVCFECVTSIVTLDGLKGDMVKPDAEPEQE